MVRMKVSDKPRDTSQPSTLRQATGIAIGGTIGLCPAISTARKIVCPKPMDEKTISSIKLLLNTIMPEISSFDNIMNYASQILSKDTNLAEKGVQIQVVTPENAEKLYPLPQNPTTFWQKRLFILKNNTKKTFMNGLNACYEFMGKKIKINDKSLYSSVFHEIGHASNFNSPITQPLGALRIFTQLTLPLFAGGCVGIGLATNKKSKDQKDRNFKDFIHDNAGKLVFLFSLPMICEEGLASLKGFHFAKKYLNSCQKQTYIKNQLVALSSYISLGLIITGLTTLGIFIKDKIVNHKKSH